MLELKNVSKFYYNNGIIASGFTKVNLKFNIGEFIVITGESGSGKSTLLNVISGLDSYEEGEMYINGKETSHYTENDFEEYRRKYIANIFQNFNLVNSYTVYQNVELVLLLNGYKKKDVKKKVLDMIDQVGLTKFKNTKVSKLSGGQKQRVAIARAMVKETPIIVADEPTGNLDVESAKEAIEILKKVSKDKLVIIVTHNIEQMEQYATRIIKMHDGRIIENTEVKKIDRNIQAETSKYSKISIFNKYRLGFRNTFNVFTKFALLFAVFLFITISVLLEYSSFQSLEYELSQEDYSYYFEDFSPNRVLIKKQDKSAFSDEDYKKIEGISNVDYVVKNDYLVDKDVIFYKMENISDPYNSVIFSGIINDIEKFDGTLDVGRMPENANEVVISCSKEDYNISNKLDKLINNKFSISTTNSYNEVTTASVVGIMYNDDDDDYLYDIYGSKELIDKLNLSVNRNFSTLRYLFNGKYTNINTYLVIPNKNVEKGKAIVNDDLKYQLSKGRIKNQPISICVDNIFYEDKLDLKISGTYTKNNFTKVTGIEEFNNGIICINEEDYNSLYDKAPYQSSVYVKEVDNIDETLLELKEIGIAPKRITDFAVQDNAAYKQVMKIVKLVVTFLLIIVLFFISYLIIKIILKSRNVYYTTLRMLGATFKSVKRILDIELFVNSNIAYFTFILIVYLVNANILNWGYVANLTSFLTIREYVLVYIILVCMSRLISRRFARKVFKKSAISTYNEEV